MHLTLEKPAVWGRRNLVAAAILASVMTLAPIEARAQTTEWPSRTVTIVGPFAAGGNNDIMARIAGQYLASALKQSFVVENRVGAAGAVAAAYVAQAPADGYTLLYAASPQIGIVPYVQKVNYHPLNDLTPVSAFGAGPFVLAINAAIPATTVDEFINYAREKSINFGSGGVASVGHLTGALFVAVNKLQATHIPFRGGAPAMTALLGGQIDMYFGNASEIIPHRDSGKVRILGVTTEKPIPQLPDTPTIPQYEIPPWNGFFAPAKTPKTIIDKLAKYVIAAARDPGVIASLRKSSIEPIGNTPEEFARGIKRDQARFDAAIEAAGIKRL